jgi:hypothetical protein
MATDEAEGRERQQMEWKQIGQRGRLQSENRYKCDNEERN